MPRHRKTSLVGLNLGQLLTKSGDAFTEKTLAAGLSVEAMEWKPNRRVLKGIPSGFFLPLQMITGNEGLRCIAPRCNAREFLLLAATGGLAIMQRIRTLTTEDRKSQALMMLIFRWSFSDRRLMGRTIRRGEDLRLRQSERGGDSDIDILPDIEITNSLGTPERLTPERLLSCGLKSATERGIPSQGVSQQINLGLLEMAHCSPALVNPLGQDDSAQIIRISLFGLDQGERTEDADLKALVEERLIQAVQKHQDLSDDEFRHWMWNDFDNIVQQLANRRSKSGEPVSRQQVRFILFDLLWRSFGYVSGCVRLQMQAVRRAIDPGLTDQERQIFGHWYDSQPWTAGLAPVLLHNRLGLLLPTLADLEDCDPGDDRPWRSLLQALQWSSEMTENRRRADCVQKQGKVALNMSSSDEDEDQDADRDLTGFEANDDCDDWISKPARRRPGQSS